MPKNKPRKNKDTPFSFVSVTIAKNEEKHISRVLDSIKKQTVPPLAMVVVDDGSTDNTARLAKENGAIVISLCDRGYSAVGFPELSDTLEVGLRVALSFKSDYILIIGGDTVIPPHYVERLHEVLISDPSLGLACGLIRSEPHVDRFPRGSGRMYKSMALSSLLTRRGYILDRVFGGDDTEVVYALKSIGFNYRIVPTLKYDQLRKTYGVYSSRTKKNKILSILSVLQFPVPFGRLLVYLFYRRKIEYKPWCYYSSWEYIKDKIQKRLRG